LHPQEISNGFSSAQSRKMGKKISVQHSKKRQDKLAIIHEADVQEW